MDLYSYFYKPNFTLYSFVVCAVGCTLRMPGSPNNFMCSYCCVGRESSFGNSPKYKGNSARFSFEMIWYRLARDVSPCAGYNLSGVVIVIMHSVWFKFIIYFMLFVFVHNSKLILLFDFYYYLSLCIYVVNLCIMTNK